MEISKAPQPVQETLTVLLDYEPDVLEITEEVLLLSSRFGPFVIKLRRDQRYDSPVDIGVV
jgi:hypothetical protein